jgi:hypothetical protein
LKVVCCPKAIPVTIRAAMAAKAVRNIDDFMFRAPSVVVRQSVTMASF